MQTDTKNVVIRRLNLTTAVVTTFVGRPSVVGMADGEGTAATFNDPCSIAMDAGGTFAVVVSRA
jgi:hypothetical protein